MGITSIALLLTSGFCLGIGLFYLFLGLRQKGLNPTYLIFSLFAFSYSITTLGSMARFNSLTFDQYINNFRWGAPAFSFAYIFLIWFVALYSKMRVRWFLGVMTAVFLFIALRLPQEVSGIFHATLPWGEQITLSQSNGNTWLLFWIAVPIVSGFILYASIWQYRRGERKEALALGLGFIFLAIAIVFDIFVDLGWINFFYISDFGFLPLAVVMGFQLSNRMVVIQEELKLYQQRLENMVAERTNELDRATAALRQNERAIRALLDAPPDTAMLLTKDGDIRATNQIGATRLGLTPENAVGSNVFDLFDPEVSDVRKIKGNEVVQKKQHLEWEDQRGGRFYRNRMYPILNEQNEVESIAVFAADITENKQVQMALQESEAKYRNLVEKINDVIYTLDLQGMVTYVSPSIEGLIGYPPPELIGQHFSQFIPPDNLNQVDAGLQLVTSGQASSPSEYLILARSGEKRWVRVSSQPIKEAEQVVGIRGVITDISRLKQAEDQLQKHIVDLNRLIEITEIISLEPDITTALHQAAGKVVDLFQARYMHIIYAAAKEEQLEIMSGFDAETGPIKPHPIDYRLDHFSLTQEIIHQGQAQIVNDFASLSFETDVRTFLAETQIRSAMLAPLKVKGKIIGVVIVSRDETQVKFEQPDLDLLEAITGNLAAAIENARLVHDNIEAAAIEERSRLARDLHDAVTQTIYSASLIAEVLPQVWARSPDEGQRNLTKLRALVRGALAEMRTMLFELRPAALEAASLETLLGQLGDALHGRTRIPVQVEVDDIPDLPLPVKLAFYRITQEAVNNIIKHAGATQTQIELKRQSGQLCLRVWDNGHGFDPKKTPNGGLGVQIMQERAESIAARFEIDSQSNQGTSLTVNWQIPPQNESEA